MSYASHRPLSIHPGSDAYRCPQQIDQNQLLDLTQTQKDLPNALNGENWKFCQRALITVATAKLTVTAFSQIKESQEKRGKK